MCISFLTNFFFPPPLFVDIPNAGKKLVRLDYRSKEWDVDFLEYLKKLEDKKPVILCGDLNVAHKEIGKKLIPYIFCSCL